MGTNVFGRPAINVLQCYPIGSYNYVGPSSRTQLSDRDEKPPGVFLSSLLLLLLFEDVPFASSVVFIGPLQQIGFFRIFF